ncbi:MAG: aldehyde dehydrogenase [Candidatus Harrisonbacteria bacterium RIFCSPHIGHO2_02_FULL_40_20]|nr:MAG: aldehyde dehydrogenase [Candidatus Harrisonbacteria bacterium RIFCSPHIGHO2_02_FULL_40_20]
MDTEKLKQFLRKLDYGPAPESEEKVRQWLKNHNRQFDHFINGKWHEPASHTYVKTENPADEEILAYVAEGTAPDVNAAMESAKNAFPLWSRLSGHERAKYLYAIARAIAKNSRLFAVLESLDNGKTIRETRDIDIPLVIRHFYYHAGWAEILETEYPTLKPGGVIAQIIPWNFPLLMLAWKIAPAIAAGNTVVLKPAEFTSLTALMFAEMLKEEVKLPSGVVNIITGDGETGKLMVNHPTPWKIAFTGSTEVGRFIRKETAGTGKHITLELGGKSPFIVFSDADLDSAVEGMVNAIWFNQGQVCCAGSRLLIEESIQDDFVNRLKARMEKLRGGKPLDKAMDIGAINSLAQLTKIRKLVAIGEKEGACLWQPESASWRRHCPTTGYYFPPTIFTNVQPSHTIAQEEIFGPVLVCISFRTPEEAIRLANNTRYGLAASVWTQDIDKAVDVAKKVKAGTIWINSTNLFDAASGFGGYRESGFGREGGREGLLDVLVEKEASVQPENSKQRAFKFLDSRPDIDRTYRFLIGGKLVRPDGGISTSVENYREEVLGIVGDANRKDVRNAVEAARNAFVPWSEQPAHLRAQILYFLAENLSIHFDRLASLNDRANFKLQAVDPEIETAIQRLFRYAAFTDKFEGTVQPVPGKFLVTAVKEPIGVIGMRAPDVYPFVSAVSMIAAAISMGNTVVIVAGKNDLMLAEFIQVIQNSDVPAGVINVLTAANPDAIAKVLAEHEDVDSIWYFGNGAGRKEVEIASAGNMKRVWAPSQMDWLGSQGESKRFLYEATQVKNIWLPYGV